MDNLFSAEQLEFLKSKFVERAECQDNHNKLDREITDIKVEMTKIEIPATVKKIGRYASTNTQFNSVTIASDCTYYDTSFPVGCVINTY